MLIFSEKMIYIEKEHTLETDYFIPLFGLSPKLGPIADWGLEIEKNAIKVDNTIDYQTGFPEPLVLPPKGLNRRIGPSNQYLL